MHYNIRQESTVITIRVEGRVILLHKTLKMGGTAPEPEKNEYRVNLSENIYEAKLQIKNTGSTVRVEYDLY